MLLFLATSALYFLIEAFMEVRHPCKIRSVTVWSHALLLEAPQ